METTINTLKAAGYVVVPAGKNAWSVRYPTADGVFCAHRVERDELLWLAKLVKEGSK